MKENKRLWAIQLKQKNDSKEAFILQKRGHNIDATDDINEAMLYYKSQAQKIADDCNRRFKEGNINNDYSAELVNSFNHPERRLTIVFGE